MKETLYTGITLMIISLIAGAALAVTNYFTAPLIEAQTASLIQDSLNRLIEADSFRKNSRYTEAYDAQDMPLGKVLNVAAEGYSSKINALVGIDNGNKITGVEIISQQETPGLGTKIAEKSFLGQFMGKTIDGLRIKKDGGKIDAVTGATISSRAITDSVRAAIEQSMGANASIAIVPSTGSGIAEEQEQSIETNSDTADEQEKEDDEEEDDEEQEDD